MQIKKKDFGQEHENKQKHKQEKKRFGVKNNEEKPDRILSKTVKLYLKKKKKNNNINSHYTTNNNVYICIYLTKDM